MADRVCTCGDKIEERDPSNHKHSQDSIVALRIFGPYGRRQRGNIKRVTGDPAVEPGSLVDRQRHDPGGDLPYSIGTNKILLAAHAERPCDFFGGNELDNPETDAEPTEISR